MPCQNPCCVPWCAFSSENEDTKRRQGICSCHKHEKVIACEKCNGLAFYAVLREHALVLQCKGCQTKRAMLVQVIGNAPVGW